MDDRFVLAGPSAKDRVLDLVARIKQGKGELPEEVREALEDTDPFLIERIEAELVDQGVSRDDIRLLCDARSRTFIAAEEIDETILERPGHPIHTLMEEHRQILMFMTRLRDTAREMRTGELRPDAARVDLREVAPFIQEAQKHFQREENVLFPYLERHGIEGPPQAMWSEHQVLRAHEGKLISLISGQGSTGDQEITTALECQASILLALLDAHFHKENHVLFPMAVRALDVHEWNEARREFESIGPCSFVEAHAPLEFRPVEVGETAPAQEVVLPTGRFTAAELEMMLGTLPVDITFVDENDRVRFYSNSTDRIFVRTPAVIGRKVQNCHPQKSVHVVQKILDDFRAGRRNEAEFWLEVGERFVHIRYFPLRSATGEYKGVLEMVQDVTAIRTLEGQKRLLDE
ncbi:MAG: PAS domain-containing protein [Methanomassiliicoccus sp.]|nr:PAS domain-containing protein [Methanomassiliicoccus sp.]